VHCTCGFGGAWVPDQPPRDFPASLPPLPAKQGSVANADVALRVSVIDGADRMVYSDVRDRKGWARPLAVNEALRDAGRVPGSQAELSKCPPRVIRELEQRVPSVRSESRPLPEAANPHQIGKANVQGRSLTAPSHPAATAAKGNPQHQGEPRSCRKPLQVAPIALPFARISCPSCKPQRLHKPSTRIPTAICATPRNISSTSIWRRG
jgi:hypothetical protein